MVGAAQTEHIPNIKAEIERDFGFSPDFHQGKHYLEANDSAGNTFKATAKPVLIGTAVVGATTMIFAIILLLFSVGYSAMSQHVTNAGAFYAYVSQGLSRALGVGSSLIALVAYNMMQIGVVLERIEPAADNMDFTIISDAADMVARAR